jgi:hypothetical protein
VKVLVALEFVVTTGALALDGLAGFLVPITISAVDVAPPLPAALLTPTALASTLVVLSYAD